MNGDLFEVVFDLQCTDRCIVNQISSYLLINKTTACNGTSSNRIINKSQPQDHDLYYFPQLGLESLEIKNLTITEDRVSLTPQVVLHTSGAEDRSNTATATVYLDTNQNKTLDLDENTIIEIPRSDWVQVDSTVSISPMVEIDAIDICNLAIIISSPANCFNDPILVPLSREQSITVEQDIYYCSQDTVKVALAEYPSCSIGFRNLDETNVLDNILNYPTANVTKNDTIYRDITCGTCLIVEQYNFNNSAQQLAIDLVTENCTTIAKVTWADGSQIPANYMIEWNGDPALSSSELTGLPSGEKIKVEINDGTGCNYMDSITTPDLATITYTVDIESFCDPDALPIINVVASGAEPMSILWEDGVEDFKRSDLVNGTYLFTVSDANNCQVSDSIVVQQNSSIDFNLPETLNDQLGTTVDLNPLSIDNDNWTWSWISDEELSCNDCPIPTLVLTETTEVRLIITSDNCTVEQTTTIVPSYSDDYYSPNIFDTRSTDNNRFLIFPNTSYDYYDMMILDRWGNIVYDQRVDNWLEDNVGWDGTFRGKEVSSGVYIYKVKLTREVDAKEETLTGEFVLIR